MENPIIVTLYSQEIKETIGLLLEQIQEEKRDHLLLGGNFNIRNLSIKEKIGEKRNEIKRFID